MHSEALHSSVLRGKIAEQAAMWMMRYILCCQYILLGSDVANASDTVFRRTG